MDKYNLIAIIDVMKGLDEEEKIDLLKLENEELEVYYRNRFLEQEDEQKEIAYY